MPYYLKSVLADQNAVELDTVPIVVGANIGDYAEWSGFGVGPDTFKLVGISTSFDSLINMRDSDIRFRPSNRVSLDFSSGYTKPADNQDFVVRVERVAANTWECFLDGQSLGQLSASENFEFDQLLRFTGTSDSLEGGLYYFEVSTSGGAATNRWDSDASNGTGNTLPDTIGAMAGSLQNFPTDDSQWVFYSAGGTGVAADAAYSISSPAFTASADATLPQPSADTSFVISAPSFSASADASLPQPSADANYSISAPLFASTAGVTLPQPQSDVSYQISAPTFSASASATIPGFSASVSYTASSPTFSATADATQPQPSSGIAYEVNAPLFSVQGDATLPQPSANSAFAVASPTFSATAAATEPGFNAAVNYSVNGPDFSASATATLPQPDADAAFNVTSPTFSVVAIVGGIAIILDDETNITVPALSTNVVVPALSTNINT